MPETFRDAENEVAQLKQDLFGAEQGILKAQGSTKKYEKQYRETLVKLERTQAGNLIASSRADQAFIESRGQQLNSATQQLNQLLAGECPKCSRRATG